MAKAPATSKLTRPAAKSAAPEAIITEEEQTVATTTKGDTLMSVGGFDIALEDAGDLPASVFASSRGQTNKLPFGEWFTKAQGATEWKHIFLPDAFWTERGSKADIKVVRNKLYKAHKDWRDKDAEGRKSELMKLVPRKQGDLDSKGRAFPSGGVSIFLRREG